MALVSPLRRAWEWTAAGFHATLMVSLVYAEQMKLRQPQGTDMHTEGTGVLPIQWTPLPTSVHTITYTRWYQ